MSAGLLMPGAARTFGRIAEAALQAIHRAAVALGRALARAIGAVWSAAVVPPPVARRPVGGEPGAGQRAAHPPAGEGDAPPRR